MRSPRVPTKASERGIGRLYCSNGHEVAVGKQAPKFCPTCGELLTARCPYGHEIPAGTPGCEQCGAGGVGTPAKPLSDVVDPVLPGLSQRLPASVSIGNPVPSHRSRTGLVLGVIVAAVLVLGVGGVAVALSIGHRSPSQPSATSAPTSQTAAGDPNQDNSEAPSAPTSPSPTATVPTGLGPSLVPVDISAVSYDSDASQVAATFETYFGGIDNQNWDLAYSAYSPQYQSRNTESSFESADGSSSDADAAITSITPGPFGSTIADVSFTSSQAPDAGPVPGESCTDWTLAYTLVPGNSGDLTYLINSAAPNGAGNVGCPGQP